MAHWDFCSMYYLGMKGDDIHIYQIKPLRGVTH